MSVYKTVTVVLNQCQELADKILNSVETNKKYTIGAVPRGGIPVLYAIYAFLDKDKFQIIDDYLCADIIIDDIEDSGRTRGNTMKLAPNALFFTLDVRPPEYIDYPWEVINKTGDTSQSIEDNYIRILQFYGKAPIAENVEILEDVIKQAIDGLV